MDEGIGVVAEITDPIIVGKLLGAQSEEEFAAYYEEYTGQELDYVPLGDESRQDKAIWKHLLDLTVKEDPNICTTPEGYKIYISMGLRRKR